jgi:hypothetical protein
MDPLIAFAIGIAFGVVGLSALVVIFGRDREAEPSPSCSMPPGSSWSAPASQTYPQPRTSEFEDDACSARPASDSDSIFDEDLGKPDPEDTDTEITPRLFDAKGPAADNAALATLQELRREYLLALLSEKGWSPVMRYSYQHRTELLVAVGQVNSLLRDME